MDIKSSVQETIIMSSWKVDRKAYAKTAILQIAMSGFKKCGIMPFHRNRFSEADFLPSVDESAVENRTTANPQNDTSPASCRPSTSEDVVPLPSRSYLEPISQIGVLLLPNVSPFDVRPPPILPP